MPEPVEHIQPQPSDKPSGTTSDHAQPKGVALPSPERPRRRFPNPVRFVAGLPRACFGPMFDKEMRAAGRRKWTYAFRSLFLLLTVLVSGMVLLGQYDAYGITNAFQRVQQMQSVAPVITLTVLWCQFGFIMLLAPVSTCDGIADERRRQTLSTLLSTPITATEIVFGKFSAAIVRNAITVLSCIPILLAIRLFGGVPAKAVVAGATLTLATACLGAGVGLWVSARIHRSAAGAMLSLFLVGAIMLLPPFGLWMLHDFWRDHHVGDWLQSTLGGNLPAWLTSGPQDWMYLASSPFFSMIAVTEMTNDATGAGAGFYGNHVWLTGAGIAAGLGIFFALASVRDTRRLMDSLASGGGDTAKLLKKRRKKQLKEQKRRKGQQPAEPARNASAYPPPLEDEPRRKKPRAFGNHPVLSRELRQPLFARKSVLIVTMGVAVVVLLVCYARQMYDQHELHLPVNIVGVLLTIAQTAIFAAGPIPHEREAQSWDVLLTTTQSPLAIVCAKALGVVRRIWLFPLLMLMTDLPAMAMGGFATYYLPFWALSLLGPVTLLLGTGTLIGMKIKKGITASMLNLAIAITIWVGIPILMLFISMVSSSIGGGDLEELAGTFVFVTHPVGMPSQVLEEAIGTPLHAISRVDVYMPIGSDLDYFGALALRSVVTLIEMGIGILCLVTSVTGFNRLNNRPS